MQERCSGARLGAMRDCHVPVKHGAIFHDCGSEEWGERVILSNHLKDHFEYLFQR
jgi:hypothetical protein